MNKRGFPEQTRNKFGRLQVSIESVVGHLYEEVTIGVGRQAVLPVPVKKSWRFQTPLEEAIQSLLLSQDGR